MALMSSGRSSGSGKWKLSNIGMMLHLFSNAQQISCNETQHIFVYKQPLKFLSHKLERFHRSMKISEVTLFTQVHLVDPVLPVIIPNAPVKGVWSKHQEEMLGLFHTLQQAVVKFPSLQFFHIKESFETSHLQVYFQQTGRKKNFSVFDLDISRKFVAQLIYAGNPGGGWNYLAN